MAASDDAFDQFDDDLTEGAEVQVGDRRKRLFSKELRCMMYGFGDDQNPYTESVDLLEDLVIEFIIEMLPPIAVFTNQHGSPDTEVTARFDPDLLLLHTNCADSSIQMVKSAIDLFHPTLGLKHETHKAMEIGRTGRVQVEDIVFLVRKDPRKYARVKDLLTMNEELKKARKAFDEVKYASV